MRAKDKQRRFSELREAAEQGTLSNIEREEWAALVEARCHDEKAAILGAAGQTLDQTAELAAQLQKVQAQNHELEALIQEREAYLTEVEAMIGRLEAQRRDWRERYEKLTGRPLDEPATVPRGA